MSNSNTKTTSIICYALMGLALALSLSGNYFYGERMAMTNEGSKWQGAAALYIDFAFAALAIVFGVLCARKKRLLATAVGFAVFVFGVVSAYSLIGFQASERINKTRTESISATAKQVAVDKRNDLMAGAYERNLSWLREQVKTASTPTEKREARRALNEALRSIPDLDVAPIQAAMPDPQATFLAELTGLDHDRLQQAIVAAMAILIVIGKGIFAALGGYLWPRASASVEVPARADLERSLVPEGAPKGRRRLQSAANDDDTDELASRVADTMDDLSKEQQQQQVRAYFYEALRPALDAPGIKATEMHKAYLAWAYAKGIEGDRVLNLNQFGRTCTALINRGLVPGLGRAPSGHAYYYKGWTFIEAAGDEEAPHAVAA